MNSWCPQGPFIFPAQGQDLYGESPGGGLHLFPGEWATVVFPPHSSICEAAAPRSSRGGWKRG